jgi:hypothetical protein
MVTGTPTELPWILACCLDASRIWGADTDDGAPVMCPDTGVTRYADLMELESAGFARQTGKTFRLTDLGRKVLDLLDADPHMRAYHVHGDGSVSAAD